MKQAPRAWYDRLSNFLIKNDFKRGQVDTTLFGRTLEKDILVVQIYVDDIIFGSTNASLCKEFSKLMQDEFEMSMMGELKFFLGIQVSQSKDEVYVPQTKYTKELLKKFKLEDCKVMNTPLYPTCTVTPRIPNNVNHTCKSEYYNVYGMLHFVKYLNNRVKFSINKVNINW